MDIDEWKKIIKSNFFDLLIPAEVGLSVLCQLLLADITNPFGLVYVDVPSSGKTITLNFFEDIEELVYTTDNFTPASFVSHASNVKKQDLEKIDLLPKIRQKMLIVRDLSTLFGQRAEDLQKTIGVLTRVFDGEGLQLEGGVHGSRGYKGDYLFMLLAASTPIRGHVWKMMGNFGARLFFMNLNSRDKSSEELAEQLMNNSVRQKEKECRIATKELVNELWNRSDIVFWDKSQDDKSLLVKISQMSQLLACLRGTINVFEEELSGIKIPYKQALIEKPDRINQGLYNLARGHAVACNRKQLNDEDLSIVSRVVISSAPRERIKILKQLVEKGGELVVEDIIRLDHKSRPTALHYMHIFECLGIVDDIVLTDHTKGRSEKRIKLKRKFLWMLSEDFKRFLDLQCQSSLIKTQSHTVNIA